MRKSCELGGRIAGGHDFRGVEETAGGARFYLIGEHRLVSATTVTGVIDKPALMRYAARKSAEGVFVELPAVVMASRVKPCGNTGGACGHGPDGRCESCPCARCKACLIRWLAERHIAHSARRADEGTRVHDVVEWWSYHGVIKLHDPDIAPYVRAFETFIADYGLTPDSFLVAEVIVVNYGAGYAGTCDGIIVVDASRSDAAAKLVSRVTGVPWKRAKRLGMTVALVVDFKTRENPGARFWPPQALQITAYRHAPLARVKNTDIEEPTPATQGGMLVQLRPDGYTVRLVMCDEDTYRNGFLPALRLTRWLHESGSASVSAHTFVLPETIAARRRRDISRPTQSAPLAQATS